MTGPGTPWIPAADTTSTDATTAIYSAIRATLLAFSDPAISNPAYQLGVLLAAVPPEPQARIFIRNVPNVNAVKYPYVTLLLDRTTILGSNGYGERALLEVQTVGNPAAQGPLVEFIADRIDRCLLSLRLSSDDFGIVTCRQRQRATAPPFTTPTATRTACAPCTSCGYIRPC
jgi:hypothetical protein